MKIKTSELTGAALDWSVAKCEGVGYHLIGVNNDRDPEKFWTNTHRFSNNWAKGGPIIEREKLLICAWGKDQWKAQSFWNEGYKSFVHVAMFSNLGPTPLIAAMRCYVASKLGDEVEIPDELCT